jgi:rubredoxin
MRPTKVYLPPKPPKNPNNGQTYFHPANSDRYCPKCCERMRAPSALELKKTPDSTNFCRNCKKHFNIEELN